MGRRKKSTSLQDQLTKNDVVKQNVEAKAIKEESPKEINKAMNDSIVNRLQKELDSANNTIQNRNHAISKLEFDIAGLLSSKRVLEKENEHLENKELNNRITLQQVILIHAIVFFTVVGILVVQKYFL